MTFIDKDGRPHWECNREKEDIERGTEPTGEGAKKRVDKATLLY